MTRRIDDIDFISHTKLIDSNLFGLFIVKILEKEQVTYRNKEYELIKLAIKNFGEYSIFTPQGNDDWKNIELNTEFIMRKTSVTSKKGLKRTKLIVELLSPKIKEISYENLPSSTMDDASVARLSILDNQNGSIIVFHNGNVYRFQNGILLDYSATKMKMGFGISFYADRALHNGNTLKILGQTMQTAIEKVSKYGEYTQDENDKKSFDEPMLAKSFYSIKTKTNNIDIHGRDFNGLFLLRVVRIEKERGVKDPRKFLHGTLSDGTRITIKIPTRIDWIGLFNGDTLLIKKTMHTGNDGMNFALLDLIKQVSFFERVEAINFEDLFNHRNGYLNNVKVDFIKKVDNYYVVVAKGTLLKISIYSIPKEIEKALTRGHTSFINKIKANKSCFYIIQENLGEICENE